MRREVMETAENVVQIITGFDSIAPVKMQIGYVGKDNICREGVLLLDAPAIVVDHIVGQGYRCTLQDGALYVSPYKSYE